MMRRTLICYFVLFGSRCPAQSLAEAMQAHTASIAALDPIKFHFSFKKEGNLLGTGGLSPIEASGQYWRSGTLQRFSYRDSQSQQDIFITPFHCTCITKRIEAKANVPAMVAGVTANAGRLVFDFLPWRDALCGLDNSERGIGAQSLPDHIQQYLADSRGHVRSGPRNGAFEIVGRNEIIKIDLDIQKNFLITCISSVEKDHSIPSKGRGPLLEREQVLAFQEIAPGIHFPKTVIFEEVFRDQRIGLKTVEFTEVTLPTKIDAEVFVPQFTPGTRVFDQIRGQEYTAGSGGAVMEPQPLERLSPAPRTEALPGEMPTLTKHESSPWGWWLLPCGVAVTLFAMAAFMWKRRLRA